MTPTFPWWRVLALLDGDLLGKAGFPERGLGGRLALDGLPHLVECDVALELKVAVKAAEGGAVGWVFVVWGWDEGEEGLVGEDCGERGGG